MAYKIAAAAAVLFSSLSHAQTTDSSDTSIVGGDVNSLLGAASSAFQPSSIAGDASSLLGAASSAVAGLDSTITATASTATAVTAAQASGSYITILAGNGYLQSGYAGSIVSADVCRTTYVVECTDSAGCGSDLTLVPSGVQISVTEGPSFQQLSTSVATDGATASLSAQCIVSGHTSATCTAAISAAAGGQSTSTSTTVTYSAKYESLLITAGSIPTGSCTSTGTGAAAPTAAFVDVYKVIAVPAAALAAAAFV